MRIKADYILREIMGEYLLIPVGSTAVKDNSISIMSETGGIIVKGLQEGLTRDDILKKILDEYDVSQEEALADYEEFIEVLRENNLLEE